MKKTFLIIALLGMGLVASCGNKAEVETTEAVDTTVVEVEAVDTTATVAVDSTEVVVAQ